MHDAAAVTISRPPAPVAMQRSQGHGRLAVHASHGRTRLAELYQQGSAKIRLPERHLPGGSMEAVLINTSGGMTGGDSLKWDIVAGSDTGLSVTTQAGEKIYKAADGLADMDVSLKLGRNARLAWLPQETILFDRSAYSRRLDVEMEEDSKLLLCEAIVFGRHGHGETLKTGFLRDRWRIRINNRLIHAEELHLEGPVVDILERPAITSGCGAVATLLAVGGMSGSEQDGMNRIIASADGVSGAVSRIEIGETKRAMAGGTGKLLARLVARDGYLLRKSLVPLVKLLNGEAGLPKSWAT